MNWYLKALKQYADFSGRARRKEYWMFTLFNLIFLYGLLFLGAGLSGATDSPAFIFIYVIYILATFIPTLAVSVRRLHDVGKSGWMLLIGIIPIVGSIWLLVLNVTDSEPGTNKWGANPKENPEIDEIGKV